MSEWNFMKIRFFENLLKSPYGAKPWFWPILSKMNFHKTLPKQSGCIPNYAHLIFSFKNVPPLRNNQLKVHTVNCITDCTVSTG